MESSKRNLQNEIFAWLQKRERNSKSLSLKGFLAERPVGSASDGWASYLKHLIRVNLAKASSEVAIFVGSSVESATS